MTFETIAKALRGCKASAWSSCRHPAHDESNPRLGEACVAEHEPVM